MALKIFQRISKISTVGKRGEDRDWYMPLHITYTPNGINIMCKKMPFSYMNIKKSPYLGRGTPPSHTLPPLGRFAPSLCPPPPRSKSWLRQWYSFITRMINFGHHLSLYIDNCFFVFLAKLNLLKLIMIVVLHSCKFPSITCEQNILILYSNSVA